MSSVFSDRSFLAPTALLAGALFACIGSSGRGQSLTLTLDSVAPLTSFSGHAGTSDFNGLAGAVNFTMAGSTGTTGSLPNQLSLFCVELGQDIVIGSSGNTYSLVNLALADSGGNASGLSANISGSGIGSVRAQYLEALYAHVFPAGYTPLALSDNDRSAFQLAVWELSHDTDFNLTTAAADPHFWIDGQSAAATQAQTWVSWVGSNYGTATLMSLEALHSDSLQDFVLPTAENFSPIPEAPTSAAALGLVAAGLACLRRLRRGRLNSGSRPKLRPENSAAGGSKNDLPSGQAPRSSYPVSIFRIPS